MKKLFCVVLLILLTIGGNLSPSVAQDDGETRVVITPENVDQLVELGRFDRVTALLPTISSDASTLAVVSDVGIELYAMATQGLISTIEHDAAISYMEFSPSGQQIAIFDDDLVLQFIDVASGEITSTIESIEKGITILEWSPDGSMIATGNYDDVLEVWDVQDGNLIQSIQTAGDRIVGVAFSPDSRIIATGVSESNARLWSIETGDLIFEVEQYGANAIAFSPDGNYLATGAFESVYWAGSRNVVGAFEIWDTVTGEVVVSREQDIGPVSTVVFADDSQTAYVANQNEHIQAVDVMTGEVVEDYGLFGSVQNIWLIDDEVIVYSYGEPFGSITEVQNLTTGTLLGTFTVRFSREFSPDLKRMIFSRFNEMYLVDLDTNETIVTLTDQLSGRFSPDSRWWLTVSAEDQSLWLWDALTGEAVHQLEASNTSSCTYAIFTTNNEFVYCPLYDDGTLWIWDVDTGQLVATYSSEIIREYVSFSPYGDIALAFLGINYEDNLRLFNIYTGETITILGYTDFFSRAIFYPDNQYVFILSRTGVGRLYDAESGEEIHYLNYQYRGSYISVSAIMPNGEEMIVGYDRGEVVRYRLPTPDSLSFETYVAYEGHESAIVRTSLSPDGQLLLTNDFSSTLIIWDVQSGEQLTQLDAGDTRIVEARFSSDGTRILIGDNSIWGIPTDE